MISLNLVTRVTCVLQTAERERRWPFLHQTDCPWTWSASLEPHSCSWCHLNMAPLGFRHSEWPCDTMENVHVKIKFRHGNLRTDQQCNKGGGEQQIRRFWLLFFYKEIVSSEKDGRLVCVSAVVLCFTPPAVLRGGLYGVLSPGHSRFCISVCRSDRWRATRAQSTDWRGGTAELWPAQTPGCTSWLLWCWRQRLSEEEKVQV